MYYARLINSCVGGWLEACTNNVNPVTGTLKLQRNKPLYSNTVIGTLAVDGWTATFGTVRRSLGGLQSHPVPSSLYQM